MKNIWSLGLGLYLIVFSAYATVETESLYNSYIEKIKTGSFENESFSLINSDVYVDALWDLNMVENLNLDIESALFNVLINSDRNIAKLFILSHYKGDFISAKKYYDQIMESIQDNSIEVAGLYILWAYKDDLKNSYQTLYKLAQENFFEEYHYFMIINMFTPKSIEEISSLVKETPTLTSNELKDYNNSPRLFLICRHSRDYPCLFIMKRDDGEFLKNGDDIWSLPALAHGRGDLKFHTTNGYTPQGIHKMDSVMPFADRPVAFGKNRRVILNFLTKTEENELEMEALPGEAKFSTWWHEAIISREVNRQYLRIHGTGRINDEPELPYYPHMTSSGCITVREGNYPEATYDDQRIMLDALMRASNLDLNFSNEENIKGLLYVVEIDDEKKAVTRSDLEKYGI